MTKINNKFLITMVFVLCFIAYIVGVRESLIRYYPDIVSLGWVLYSVLALVGIAGSVARKYPMWITGLAYGLLGIILYIV